MEGIPSPSFVSKIDVKASELIYDWNQQSPAPLRPSKPVLLNDETLHLPIMKRCQKIGARIKSNKRDLPGFLNILQRKQHTSR